MNKNIFLDVYLKNIIKEDSGKNEDGWNEDVISTLSPVLEKIDNLNYELNNCIRGTNTKCTNVEELREYIQQLGNELIEISSNL